MKTAGWMRALALGAMLATGAARAEEHDHDHGGVQADAPLAAHVRAANGRFLTFNPDALKKEGYAAIPCTSSIDGGAMGIHYVNGAYLGDVVSKIERPQAVMYEPDAQGHMHLVGVEYITFKGPATLEGQLFAFQNSPNRYGLDPFYELHVWAWKQNPRGAFADFNPHVTCAFAK